MNYIRILPIILVFGLFVSAKADRCHDYLLLDGSEPLLNMGLDSTHNWWAITQPFENRYKMYINDFESAEYLELSKPVFSFDGERWAFFGFDGATWYIENELDRIILNTDRVGEIQFSRDSEFLVYSIFDNQMETIFAKDNQFRIMNRQSKIFVNNDGSMVAYTAKRGGNELLFVNGEEYEQFEQIEPIGFWHTDEFVYAASDGVNWTIFKGKEKISDSYETISSIDINLKGEYLGFAASYRSGDQCAILIADEFKKPIIGKTYLRINDLIVHPHIPMIAYFAVAQRDANLVVFNSTEYFGGRENSKPQFSYDGEDLFFFGCNIDCFINVNGQKTDISRGVDINAFYAKKSNSNTYAYTTSTSLMVRDFIEDIIYAGKMMDQTIQYVRYNWRYETYESLGVINNRLYLQTCEF